MLTNYFHEVVVACGECYCISCFQPDSRENYVCVYFSLVFGKYILVISERKICLNLLYSGQAMIKVYFSSYSVCAWIQTHPRGAETGCFFHGRAILISLSFLLSLSRSLSPSPGFLCRYPIQAPRPGCYGDREDSPGVRNYGNRSPDELFDVYCFAKRLQGRNQELLP